jgi:hypothetical protein
MRYGLYFAPGTNEAFHDLGASWLGRDAASGQAVEHPDLEGLGATELSEITGPARRYGFHATLKAPFRSGGRSQRSGSDRSHGCLCRTDEHV